MVYFQEREEPVLMLVISFFMCYLVKYIETCFVLRKGTQFKDSASRELPNQIGILYVLYIIYYRPKY